MNDHFKTVMNPMATWAAKILKEAVSVEDVQIAVLRFAGVVIPLGDGGYPGTALRVTDITGTPHLGCIMANIWQHFFPKFPGEKLVLGMLERIGGRSVNDPKPVVLMGCADRYIYVHVHRRMYWSGMSLADFLVNGPRFDMLYCAYPVPTKQPSIPAFGGHRPNQEQDERKITAFLRFIAPAHPPEF